MRVAGHDMLPCFGVQCRDGCGTLCTARSPGNDRVDGLAHAAITTVVSAARGLVTARTWHNTTMTRPGARRDMTSRIAALRTSRRPKVLRRRSSSPGASSSNRRKRIPLRDEGLSDEWMQVAVVAG